MPRLIHKQRFVENTSHQSGNNLLKMFNDLDINTGNISKLTIHGWFDTDCEATKEMFEWMSKHLSKDNVLTPLEIDEYEQLKQSGRLFSDKQYDQELFKLTQTYPGILDYEENALDVECMEGELDMLISEKEHLEQMVILQKDIKHKLSKTLNSLQEEEIMYTLHKTSAEEKCIDLSTSVDIIRERVEHQIIRYSEHLNNFDYDTCTFLSNIPLEKFDQNYQDIMSYLSLFRKQGDLLQGNDMCEENLEELEILRERIATSHLSYIMAKNKEERLKGELEFIQNAKGKDLSKSQSFDNSFQILNESKLVAQEIMLSELHSRIESIVKKAADAIIDKPKIEVLKQILEKESENLNLVKKINAQTTIILAKYLLQYSLLNKEKDDIDSTDSFFRKVHKYIIHNVYNSQLRSEAMAEIISKYRQYKELPLEEKLPLVNIKKELLAKNADDSTPILELIKEFDKEYRQMEHQVFVKDFVQHRQFAQVLEREVENLHNFLITGPTSQIIVVPHILRDTFYEINQLINVQRMASKTTLQKFNSALKTLSERKWFKIRRQLWMWFLIEPKKVLLAINQIEAYVKQIGNKM